MPDLELVDATVEDSQNIDIDDLEKDFGSFIVQVEKATSSIGKDVNIDELNEIGDEIIKAKEYLSSFASGEKKTMREKAYGQFTNMPVLGGWAKDKVDQVRIQNMKDSGAREVFEEMFGNFNTKKKRLVKLTYLAEALMKNLVAQETHLAVYVQKLDYIIQTSESAGDKMRAYDMSIQAQSSEKVIQDQVHNKLAFIIELMTTLMNRMSKTLPVIKTQLLNETSFAGMISSISDTVKMMDSLQDLTNEIAQTSTANIQGLIVDVSKTLTKGTDIEFYKQSAITNEKFHKTMVECQVKRIETTLGNYDTLKQISVDSSNLLESRKTQERIALGMDIKAAKEAVKAPGEVIEAATV